MADDPEDDGWNSLRIGDLFLQDGELRVVERVEAMLGLPQDIKGPNLIQSRKVQEVVK